MNVFDIQQKLVDDYRTYVESFVTIRDERINTFVHQEYAKSKYWPEAIVQLSPSFAPGSTIPELVDSGLLHREIDPLLQIGVGEAQKRRSLHLHRHQQDAIEIAVNGHSYVLTTGTGSGKSLSYFIPIFDRVLRNGRRPGLTAIVVYPMNALCNSQYAELERFLGEAGSAAIRYERYTGQEDEETRQRIRANPPHILLTNYVMLELMLTRSEDAPLLNKAGTLEFLVLDELHTYRGRQGADVAMLVRRLRNRVGDKPLQYVGTSATMASEGTHEQRQQAVAEIASLLFGAQVYPEHVIGETLLPLTSGLATHDLASATRQVMASRLPASPVELLAHPLAAWIERTFGITERDGRLDRVTPITISEGAERLAREAGVGQDDAAEAIRRMLLLGFQFRHPETDRPVFAFRLHQFISRGNTVFSTLDEPASARFLSLDGQSTVPGTTDRKLYPLAFCRSCGEAYFTVEVSNGSSLVARQFGDMSRKDDADRTTGYLWLDPNWQGDGGEPFTFEAEQVPDQYLQERRDGPSATSAIRKRIVAVTVTPTGEITLLDGDGPSYAWFIQGNLPFCLHCRETWSAKTGEFTKLGSLASEGRAGATTIISLKLVQAMRASEELAPDARKLLSFTDNRQDAALQAGHFNDFMRTSLLRAAILAAIPEHGEQTYDTLPTEVVSQLHLDHAEYAMPGVQPERYGESQALKAFRQVITWHVFRDLRRGWRVNQPNLEQLGLLEIAYRHLDDLAADTDLWGSIDRTLRDLPHQTARANVPGERPWGWLNDPALPGVVAELVDARPELRRSLIHAILEFFRTEQAIHADILTEDGIDQLKRVASNNLNDTWRIDPNDRIDPARPLRVGAQQRKGRERAPDLTPTSRIGMIVGEPTQWGLQAGAKRRSTQDRLLIMHVLTRVLADVGILREVEPQLFLLRAEHILWKRRPGTSSTDARINEFFRDYYLTLAGSLGDRTGPASIRALRASEHTAQVDADDRRIREEEFRTGALPVLYCSPTMELGVDIASLNAVNMRNVPPTPANYAQRSGRAGRAGQPAIVVTYCAAYSPHDQYYFENRKLMVSGAVTPPRIDLANRDLVASHMRAVWLAETAVRPGTTVAQMLETGNRDLPLKDQLAVGLNNQNARERALARCGSILDGMAGELSGAHWFRPEWITTLLAQAPGEFDRACDRWRELFRSAVKQQEIQNARSQDLTITVQERETAMRLRQEAESQRELLLAEQDTARGSRAINYDFNPFRYLASEGFLPGYNFPRLPLTAYIPAQRSRANSDVYLQRPRFIAISEYGPGNTIYYEGNRYRVERIDIPTSNDGNGSVTESIRICQVCGYAHLGETLNADLCNNPTCGAQLMGPFTSHALLRLQNVRTRRQDRITSEEEERVRQGYDLMTAIQFGAAAQGMDLTRGVLLDGGGDAVLDLAYAPAATIWRINLGWRRRRNKAEYGFTLDLTQGRWSRTEDPSLAESDTDNDLANPHMARVVPYVRDRQNALTITPALEALDRLSGSGRPDLTPADLLSVGYALKRGICIAFQLEDSELGVELLPDDRHPRCLLFTESSEGGAGVLEQLVTDPGALTRASEAALVSLHFDPATGSDLGTDARCGIACYHCLLSYGNQRYHDQLSRYLARPFLGQCRSGRVAVSGVTMDRETLRDELLKLAGSTLETRFVHWLHEGGYRLPDQAQPLIENGLTRPDFYLDDGRVCIYVDGPHHQHPDRQMVDDRIRRQLRNRGYQVVVVTTPDLWRKEIAEHRDIFGSGGVRT